jgi:riboflavin biosynthesis pyrimidine reductase
MVLLQIVMTADGKIVTSPSLLKQFNISPSASFFQNADQVEELSIILLPIVMGGVEMPTITGLPGAFLKDLIEFALVRKKVRNKICYLTYRKKYPG